MKKIIVFGGVVVLLFVLLAFITSYQNQQQSEGNPFEKDSLASETIDQLDDPLYQNIILPEDLADRINNKEDVTVYFYSGQCEFCNMASSLLVPKAEEMGVDLQLYNILEFPQGWDDYQIEGTPVVVHFENGEEQAKIEGLHDEEAYEIFYEQVVLKD
ncbi:thioredoxin family protein [Salipaludibacillus daqingensis]|uniref:thioredoxin family protein n=1 Tax=Salipaludibacillus daqingensis TaxID=3041001 RepID=UPI002474534C|nr:thioredoxin family protein [Salipaludibacillus daqingensis]